MTSPTKVDDANLFTASSFRDAQREPTLDVGPLHYRGKLLSIEEWLPFFERFGDLERARVAAVEAKQPVDLRVWIQLWIDYLSAVFPRSHRRWWQPDPVQLLRKEPGETLKEAFYHFFFHQARVFGIETPSLSSGSPADGTSSESSTAGAPTSAEGPE